MPGVLRQLADRGVAPATVIDVGAAGGTMPLYETWPGAHHLLIEPLTEFAEPLAALGKRYRATVVHAVAASATGTATLNVHPDLEGSSLLLETEEYDVNGTPREVPAVTLDRLVAEHGLSGPYLIKADVQGAELQVLEGAGALLGDTQAVVLETTLFGTFAGGPQFLEVCDWMAARGFAVYDMFGWLYRPLDGAMIQLDVVFVPADGPLRAEHHYATATQRREQFGE